MKNSYSNSVSSSLMGRDEKTHSKKETEQEKILDSSAKLKEVPASQGISDKKKADSPAPGRPTLESKGLKKRKQITITLTEEMHQEAMSLARAENLSLAKYIEKALAEYKENHHSDI